MASSTGTRSSGIPGPDIVRTSAMLSRIAESGYGAEVISAAAYSCGPDVARTLDLLRLRDDDHVLEIGTGAGLLTALLCQRVGDSHVFSIEIDPARAAKTCFRLHGKEFYPELAVGDGARGWAHHGLYHRLVSRCPVMAVPWPWVEQLTPDGRALLALQPGGHRGYLAVLERTATGLEGRFTGDTTERPTLQRPAPLAGDAAAPVNPTSHEARVSARIRPTSIDPQPWTNAPVVWFLAQLILPTPVTLDLHHDGDDKHAQPDGAQPCAAEPCVAVLAGSDTSSAMLHFRPNRDGSRTVTESGPTPLWAGVEAAEQAWTEYGRPSLCRFGLTVTHDEQWVWLDHPDAPDRWTLPAVAV